MGEAAEGYPIIPCRDEREAARMACRMVKDKEADIPMKGLAQTASFMRAILDKEAYGFVPDGSQLSQATVMGVPGPPDDCHRLCGQCDAGLQRKGENH